MASGEAKGDDSGTIFVINDTASWKRGVAFVIVSAYGNPRCGFCSNFHTTSPFFVGVCPLSYENKFTVLYAVLIDVILKYGLKSNENIIVVKNTCLVEIIEQTKKKSTPFRVLF